MVGRRQKLSVLQFFCFCFSSRIPNFSVWPRVFTQYSIYTRPLSFSSSHILSRVLCFGDHLPCCWALYIRCFGCMRILSKIPILRVDLWGLVDLNSFFSFPCNFSEMLQCPIKCYRGKVRDHCLEIEICSVSLSSCYRIWFLLVLFLFLIVRWRMYREMYI